MENTAETIRISEIPPFGLRAYALFFSRHGTNEEFTQNELDWIVGQSMKKKIFSLLLNSGWIAKKSKNTYVCLSPQEIFKKILEFKVPQIIEKAIKKYAFTNLSAIEIWSDYSYVQRGIENSPYFIKVLRKDLNYWKSLFNKNKVPNYVKEGSTIGEYVIFIPVDKIEATKKGNLQVEKLKETMNMAKENNIYLYAYNYIKDKYGRLST
jgi:hypothetical protein